MVVTDRQQAAAAGHRLEDVVAAAVEGGARVVLLREKDLPRDQRTHLAQELLAALAPVGGSLVVAGDGELAWRVGAAGVHLAATQPAPSAAAAARHPSAVAEDRQPYVIGEGGPPPAVGVDPPGSPAVGRSCHSVRELLAARAAGLDYATLSPVWSTDSKPGYGPPLGVEGLGDGCAAVPGFPVFALGGVRAGRVAACLGAGAAGIAVMGAIMRADDPAKVVRTLLEEMP
jgi:thiamine-phosphate pyrophosphorylase